MIITINNIGTKVPTQIHLWENATANEEVIANYVTGTEKVKAKEEPGIADSYNWANWTISKSTFFTGIKLHLFDPQWKFQIKITDVTIYLYKIHIYNTKKWAIKAINFHLGCTSLK